VPSPRPCHSWQTFRMSLEVDCRARYAACLGQNCTVEYAELTARAVRVGVPNTGVERSVTLPMLRFPRSILSLTSLGRAWQALSTVITTST
jgi:hypothetical protein